MSWQSIKLKFWQAGDEKEGTVNAVTYAGFINTWYQKIRAILEWPLQQLRLEDADLFIVDLIAYERNIERFTEEPESLYRLRVKHAYMNAKDAGSVVGFRNIWKRLGLGDVSITERAPNTDWDIVFLGMDAAEITGNDKLLQRLINKYGRTCRRYYLTTQNRSAIGVAVANLKTEFSLAVTRSELQLPERGSGTPENAALYNGTPATYNGTLATYTPK